jgi:xanthine permease XanP
MRKPADLAYGLDDRPPPKVLLSAALQQTAIILVFVYPAILVGRAAGSTPLEAASILSLTFVACGVGTLIHAYGRWGIGSGFLAPAAAAGGAFLAPSLIAAQVGGPSMLAGMTMVAGVATLALSRLLRRLRALLPPEIAGTVLLIVGMVIALTGVRLVLDAPGGEAPTSATFLVAAVTLAVAGGLSIWGKGMLRWTCVLIALVVGSLVALALGETGARAEMDLSFIPVIGLPDLAHIGYAFDPALLPAFLIAALSGAVRDLGLATTLQKMNDADWVRPDQGGIAKVVAGDGATILVAGLLGAPACNMSVTNISMQAATGISSRVIALGTAGACFVLACFPRAAALVAQVPAPVIAAILVQAGGQMMVNGMQVATSRMLDARKPLTIGLAVVTALAVEVTPGMRDWVGPAWRPLLSAIALGTLVAIGLNALLRIGIRKQVTMTLPPGEIQEAALRDVITRAGQSWGARPDVIARTTELAIWSADAIVGHRLAEGEVTVTLGFDEFRIDLSIGYRGRPLDLSEAAPSAEELLDAEDGAAKFAGHMIRRRASRATLRHRDGMSRLAIVIDH